MPDTKEEATEAEVPKEEAPKETPPNWEYKTDFAINTKMREVVAKSIEASELELAGLLRKLDKLTYGS
jgi:hypothetical protein